MKSKVTSPVLFFDGLKTFWRRLFALFRQPIFIFITLWGHVSIAAGTIGLYYFEHATNPKVHTLLDTFYWTIATVTTVGYGDATPITLGGKVVGLFLMIVGSIFLWSYTALFAGALVAPEIRLVEDEVRRLEMNVEEVEEIMRLDEKTVNSLLKEIRLLRDELQDRSPK